MAPHAAPYTLLVDTDGESQHGTSNKTLSEKCAPSTQHPSSRWTTARWLATSMTLLIATNLIQALCWTTPPPPNPHIALLNGGPSLPFHAPRLTSVPNVFMSHNASEADAAWAGIKPGYGLVQIPREEAVQKGLDLSKPHPWDDGMIVFSIEAYHAMHCIKVIRSHYRTLEAGGEISWDVAHNNHCFDTIRQHIMCQADSTLLTGTGKRDSGHHTTRLCRDWDRLREWAGERSACYRDWDPPEGGSRWGHCDGDDGLPRGGVV